MFIACDDHHRLQRSVCPDHLVDVDVGADADDNTDADNNIDIGLVFHSRVIGHRFKTTTRSYSSGLERMIWIWKGWRILGFEFDKGIGPGFRF